MNALLKEDLSATAAAFALILFSAPAQAGGTMELDKAHWISVGAGVRASFTGVEDGAPNGRDYSKDFNIDNMRLYVNGQMHDYVKFTFNTDNDVSETNIRLLDAIARFEFTDTANIWIGRFLPPTDRANLDGPFYLGTYDFPFVNAYPAIFAGRDNGAAFWGQIGKGKFKYQIGAFEGRRDGSNQEDSLL